MRNIKRFFITSIALLMSAALIGCERPQENSQEESQQTSEQVSSSETSSSTRKVPIQFMYTSTVI